MAREGGQQHKTTRKSTEESRPKRPTVRLFVMWLMICWVKAMAMLLFGMRPVVAMIAR